MGDGLNADGLGFRENIFGNVGSRSNPTPGNGVTIPVPPGSTASEINQIIADAGSDVIIDFIPGSYPRLSEPIKVDAGENITLDGPGWGNTLSPETDREINLIEAVGDAQGGTYLDKITVRNFDLDGDKDNVTDGGDALNQSGIFVQNVRDADVSNNYVKNTKYSNIRVSRCPRINIYRNVTDTTETNANTSDKPPDNISIKNEMTGWSIVSNVCLNCGHQAIETSTDAGEGYVAYNYIENSNNAAIQVHFAANTPVVGNVIKDCQSSGIVADNPGGPVVGNTIDTVVGSGIIIKDSAAESLTIVGNTINNPDQHGIACDVECDDMTIGFNTIRGATNDGIRVVPATGSVTAQIGFNSINGARDGVRLNDNDSSIVSHCTIKNTTSDPISGGGGNTDVSWHHISPPLSSDPPLTGTRSRFNGLIGWFSGTDLSSTTGQQKGDMALADGTSAASADALAVWTGSAWTYYNPDGTV